jgi:hypothetical protein
LREVIVNRDDQISNFGKFPAHYRVNPAVLYQIRRQCIGFAWLAKQQYIFELGKFTDIG